MTVSFAILGSSSLLDIAKSHLSIDIWQPIPKINCIRHNPIDVDPDMFAFFVLESSDDRRHNSTDDLGLNIVRGSP